MSTQVPNPAHVTELRDLLDLLTGFSDNDQRARYLLTSNWMRDHGAEAARLAGTPLPTRPAERS